jgi:hypothetical protein
MKTLILIIAMLPIAVFAQKIDLKDVDADSESTTIEISKGKKKQQYEDEPKCKPNWEITEGSADIQGDGANMMGEAKKNHKKACEDWKKEFRADNKENKIITMSCGNPSCNAEAMEKTCSSRATYKIKTRMD